MHQNWRSLTALNLDGVKEKMNSGVINIGVYGRPQKKLSNLSLFMSHQMHNIELHQAHVTYTITELAQSTFKAIG